MKIHQYYIMALGTIREIIVTQVYPIKRWKSFNEYTEIILSNPTQLTEVAH